MQKSVPVGEGAMCAVLGAEDQQVIDWCKLATTHAKSLRANPQGNSPAKITNADTTSTDATTNLTVACTVEPANFNAPGQTVVSGSIDAVAALEKLITEQNIRGVLVKRLNVSAPFHCSLMKPAREVMETLFARAKKESKLSRLSTPYIANRTAKLTGEHSVIFELLAEQVDHSVLWKQSVETLFAHGYQKAFEFGPGKVLQGLNKRIAKGALDANGAPVVFEVYPIYDLETLKFASEKTGA